MSGFVVVAGIRLMQADGALLAGVRDLAARCKNKNSRRPNKKLRKRDANR
jgi:hypothetical protein